jgi:hypothetical protein
MEQLIHITAAYSNAVLVALLPHVSDFAKKLDLPIVLPITREHINRFEPNRYKGHIDGSFWLTNGYWFSTHPRGYVSDFRSPRNSYTDEDLFYHPTNYIGQTRMTTNEMLAFARETLLKLGYPPAVTRADTIPEHHISGELNGVGHVPYCRIRWHNEDSDESYSSVQIDINNQDKTVVGISLSFARTNKIGTPVKVDIEPELEADFRKRTKVNLFFRTNVLPHVPKPPSPIESSDK